MEEYKEILKTHNLDGVLLWAEDHLEIIHVSDDCCGYIPKIRTYTDELTNYTEHELSIIKEYTVIWDKLSELISDKIDGHFLIKSIENDNGFLSINIYHYSYTSSHTRFNLHFSESVLSQESLEDAPKPKMTLFGIGLRYRIYKTEISNIYFTDGSQMIVNDMGGLSAFRLSKNPEYKGVSNIDEDDSLVLLYDTRPPLLDRLQHKLSMFKRRINFSLQKDEENDYGEEIPF